MESDRERGERIETVQSVASDEDRLVSVAVPHDESLGEYLEEAEEAHADAEYFDDQASEPLREAFEGTVRVLHDVEDTPEDGLAAYVGVVDGDLTSFVFEDPPGRVTEGVFEHGNEFVTHPLEHGSRTDRTVGLIVVERGGAAVGRLRGEGVETLETLDSDVPGKTRAGGQSADRFRRRREERKREFFDEVADVADREFDDPDAVVLGGTDVTVDAFRDGDHLPGWLADRVSATHDVEYADERGLERLAEQARGEALDVHEDARAALDEFFDRLPDDEVAYGRGDVDDALTYGAVGTLLVAESLPAAEREEYVSRAEDEEGDTVVVPDGIERGERFAEAFDGVGALLRFPLE